MKTCQYRKGSEGYYQWSGPADESCVFAVHENRPVSGAYLYDAQENGIISQSERDAIMNMDSQIANKKELDSVKKIANRLNIKMELID